MRSNNHLQFDRAGLCRTDRLVLVAFIFALVFTASFNLGTEVPKQSIELQHLEDFKKGLVVVDPRSNNGNNKIPVPNEVRGSYRESRMDSAEALVATAQFVETTLGATDSTDTSTRVPSSALATKIGVEATTTTSQPAPKEVAPSKEQQEQVREPRKQRHERVPIIVVPGSMGSILEGRLNKTKVVSSLCSKTSDWYKLWISPAALVASQCFFDNIYMKYKGEGRMENADGVETRVPFFGDSVRGIRCMIDTTDAQCYATRNWMSLLNGLQEENGYRVGVDLFSAPFDFRRGPDDYMTDSFPKLKALIEDVYESTGRRVCLSSISLGAMVVHTFLTHFVDQPWKDKYVERWFSLSGVFNGFSQSFHNTVFGRDQFLGFSFRQTDVRNAYRTWFSAAWLIPKDIYGFNRILLQTPSRNYTLSDVDQVLRGDQLDMYKRSLRYNMTADPGVRTHCWYGKGSPTTHSYRIKVDMSEEVYYDKKGIEVEEIMSSGDGACDVDSLEVCKQWKSTEVAVFGGICHSCFLRSPTAIQPITKFFEAVNKNMTAR